MAPQRDDSELDEFEDVVPDALDDDELSDTQGDVDYVDEELGDENWDDGQQAEQKPKQKKKKGGAFNLILILAGVGLFVGFVYVKMMSAPVPAPVVGPEQQAATAPAPVVVDSAPPPGMDATVAMPTADVATAPTAPMPDTGVPIMPEPVAPMPTDMPPAISPVTPDMPVAPVPEPIAAAPQPDMTIPATPMIEAAPAQPAIDTQPAPVAMTEPVAPLPEPVAAAPAPVAMTAPAVDDARLQGIEDRLSALAASVEQTQGMGTAMQTLADQLSALNKRLDQIESSRATTPAAAAPLAPAPASVAPAAPESVTAAPAPAPRRAAVRPKWSLRAVSNGVAYIMPAKGGDLRPVKVGDEVPGLGTIEGIEQVNGHWQVKGSAGRVTQ